MPAATRRAALGDVAALGAISGLRTFTGPAILALRGRWGDGPVARLVPLGAVGELVGDKLPAIPPRSDAPALLARIASGAAAGATLAGPRGAGLGAAAATATTYASERLRAVVGKRTGVPDPVLGLIEDGLAIGIALWATRGGAAGAGA